MAPRAWYMEAVEHILSLDNVYRHPLDACLFLVFISLRNRVPVPSKNRNG